MISNFPKVTQTERSRMTSEPTLLPTGLDCHSALVWVSTLCKPASVPSLLLGLPSDMSTLHFLHAFQVWAKFKSPLPCGLYLDHGSMHGPPHPLSSYSVYFSYHSFGTERCPVPYFYRNISYVSGTAMKIPWEHVVLKILNKYCWFCGVMHLIRHSIN